MINLVNMNQKKGGMRKFPKLFLNLVATNCRFSTYMKQKMKKEIDPKLFLESLAILSLFINLLLLFIHCLIFIY